MLASILVGFVPPSPLSLGALFFLVTMSLTSLPFSLLLFESRLVCLRSLSLLLQAICLLHQRWSFLILKLATIVVSLFDGSRPPRGLGHNVFQPCPYCGKKNPLANKSWKQFSKPPSARAILTPLAPFSPALLSILAPQYHVTFTSAEYDTLRHSASIDASSSASLASLLAPSTLGTSALLASSSPSWIMDSWASSHMTTTSSLLSSYHPTPSHPPITIFDG